VLSISAPYCLSAHHRSRNILRKLSIALCILIPPAALRAQVFSYAGKQTALTVTGLSAPASVAVDASGNRFIVRRNASNIIEVSASGVQSTISAGFVNPISIAVDSSDNLFVADYGSSHVIKVPAGGGTEIFLGTGLSHPTSVAVDSQGNPYIADSGNGRVLKIAASSGAQSVVASGTFTTPVGLAIDSGNHIYVSDTGAQKLFEISSIGATVSIATVLTGLTDQPADIAVDSADDILFSGGLSHTVTMYQVPAQLAVNGVETGTIRQLGTGLSDPLAIALDSAGNVYVADQTTPAIYIIAPGSINLGQANVCPAAGTQTAPCSQAVTLNFNVASTAALTAVSPRVVTQGGANLDFTSSANSCTGTLTGPTTCSITLAFNPLAPGVRLGSIDVSGTVGSASSSSLLATVALQGLGTGPLAGFDAGAISPLPVTLSSNPYIGGVIADSSGNLYFVDNNNCVVDKFLLATATTSVVAGSGTCGATAGDGGPATSAVFKEPWRLALNGRGDLYISDDLDGVIRKVDAVTGIIKTIAGTAGTLGHSPDGTVAANAILTHPFALALDGAGNLYFTDWGEETVRMIGVNSGVLTTVAGNYQAGSGYGGDQGPATAAQLNNPLGVAVDSADNVYIADAANDAIRKVTVSTGIITTVAGVPQTAGYAGDGAAATSANLNNPQGIAVDAAGNLYIGEYGNYVVRKVNAGTGFISTVGGTYTGDPQNTGSGGAANLAGLSYVQDVTVDSGGNFYIADSGNSVIDQVTSSSGIVDFTQTTSSGAVSYPVYTIGTSSPAIDVAVTNNGNAPLDLSSLVTGVNFNTAGADTSCTPTATLSASDSCILGVEFLPTASGGLTGTLTLTDNAGNALASTQTLALKGTGAYVPTQVALGAVPATITAGGNLGALTATIESSGGNVVTNSTASVTATITGPGGYSQTVSADATSGVATINLSSLALTTAGTYSITASSTGLTSSAAASVTVLPAPAQIAVSALPASLVAGSNLGLVTATIEDSTGNVVTGSTASVTITITSTGYSHAVTASAVNGVATLDLSSLTLTAAGTYTVTTTSPGLPTVTASVTVAAIDFTLALGSGSTSTQTVAAGAAATYTLSVAPTTATYAQPITFSVTGLPSGATASFSPASVTPGSAPVTTTLTIQTAASTAAVRDLQGIGTGMGGTALGLLLLPVALSRRLRQALGRMPMTVLLGLIGCGAVCGLIGCGGGSAGSSAPPPQTYTLTVTATSGSLSHSTTVTLIVQ
jgi:sugar lactone lactonase YvrE